ncbi:MAG: sigma factor [Microbacterium sp.]
MTTIAPETPAHSGSDLDALIREIAAGSQAAFAQLYDEISSQVHGIARHLLPNETLAEQATMDTFCSVWRHADRIDRSDASARSWILQLAHQHARLSQSAPPQPLSQSAA